MFLFLFPPLLLWCFERGWHCPVADGTEDIEFTTVTDILVRAGIQVVTASVMPSKTVTLGLGFL
jgi:putative intracellular protease/amidase